MCIDVTPLKRIDSAFGPREVFKLVFETDVLRDDGRPHLVWSRSFTPSLHEKAAFRAFLRDYPQSALAPNATYWIGICQANLKDYKAALATQEGLLTRYPQSPKAPDALLAVAAVQSEQGDHGSARNTLEDIIARYPGSEAAGKARTRLAALKR